MGKDRKHSHIPVQYVLDDGKTQGDSHDSVQYGPDEPCVFIDSWGNATGLT